MNRAVTKKVICKARTGKYRDATTKVTANA
jgi:hypothetical protein